ncbi:DUF732 domain-containing protein [Rhodococcus sp. W8901]|uniref:DUF732 domain-containing protein n=1 Tax=Rhodococcus sp. W8901 TaxID=2742603 RepID=UPI0015818EB0|nr:DUF732 domain-containing protein [Rhodococcus sp. W8901]QKT11821.1 hypothetical protein HUN07_14800 [Rhodococcus sp. W8901]
MSTPTSLRRGLRSVMAGVIGAVGIVSSVTACGAPAASDSAAAATETVTTTPASEPATTASDARTARYARAVLAGGFPPVVPDPTLFAVGEGVCRQLAAGTPDSVVLEQLRPVSDYAASLSGGALTGESAAQLLLSAARTDFC